MSSSFKRLQAERDAADLVLRELNIVDGIADTDGLRQHLQGLANQTLVRLRFALYLIAHDLFAGPLIGSGDRLEKVRGSTQT